MKLLNEVASLCSVLVEMHELMAYDIGPTKMPSVADEADSARIHLRR